MTNNTFKMFYSYVQYCNVNSLFWKVTCRHLVYKYFQNADWVTEIRSQWLTLWFGQDNSSQQKIKRATQQNKEELSKNKLLTVSKVWIMSGTSPTLMICCKSLMWPLVRSCAQGTPHSNISDCNNRFVSLTKIQANQHY